MGNSESHSRNYHHEDDDGCKEAEYKLEDCVAAHYNPKMAEIGMKWWKEGLKATFHEEDVEPVYSYLKRGACEKSVTAYEKAPDRDKHETMWECMEAHPKYYHKYLSMVERFDEQVREEIESTYPFIHVPDRSTAIIYLHEPLTEGGCCVEQYAAYKEGCCMPQMKQKMI